MLTTNSITAFVLKVYPDLKYGFVRTYGSSTDTTFVQIERLSEAGFNPEDFKEGADVTLEREFVTKTGRWRATKVTEINGRLAPRFFSEDPVDSNSKRSASVSGEIADVHLITKVKDRSGLCYGYRVYELTDAGRALRGTYPRLSDARESIGRVITPPLAQGHGERTNVVRAEPKKKKKAA